MSEMVWCRFYGVNILCRILIAKERLVRISIRLAFRWCRGFFDFFPGPLGLGNHLRHVHIRRDIGISFNDGTLMFGRACNLGGVIYRCIIAARSCRGDGGVVYETSSGKIRRAVSWYSC